MSFAALAWAAKQRPGNLAAKMVLIALANYADEHGCAYPSTAALAEFGDMDHKTATAALDRLIELKLIADSGQRAGRTKQIKVYRLALLESAPETEASQMRKPSENGSLPVLSLKAPRKRGTDTVKEPIPQKASPSSGSRAHGLPRRATRVPADFVPVLTERAKAIVSSWPTGRLENEVEQWQDHHRAKGTAAEDWQASFRTWLRNAEKFASVNTSSGGRATRFRDPLLNIDAREGQRTTGNPMVDAALYRQDRRRERSDQGAWALSPGMEGSEPISLDAADWAVRP